MTATDCDRLRAAYDAYAAGDLEGFLERVAASTAEALVTALEAKDAYTAGHSSAVAQLAVAMARRLGVTEPELTELRYGAILHDIGKLAVPDAILSKPGPLSDAERALVARHPATGERIIASLPFLHRVRGIVRHDHEAWDGTGYPDGLRGEEIPLGARIVAVADAYHAMRSDRPYRRRMDDGAARRELRACAGSQFDPRAVDALIAVLDERGPARSNGAASRHATPAILVARPS